MTLMAHDRNLVSLVVPCFNEEAVIDVFYGRVSKVARDLPSYAFEFLFVDDGSTDNTAARLRQLGEEDGVGCP